MDGRQGRQDHDSHRREVIRHVVVHRKGREELHEPRP